MLAMTHPIGFRWVDSLEGDGGPVASGASDQDQASPEVPMWALRLFTVPVVVLVGVGIAAFVAIGAVIYWGQK